MELHRDWKLEWGIKVKLILQPFTWAVFRAQICKHYRQEVLWASKIRKKILFNFLMLQVHKELPQVFKMQRHLGTILKLWANKILQIWKTKIDTCSFSNNNKLTKIKFSKHWWWYQTKELWQIILEWVSNRNSSLWINKI